MIYNLDVNEKLCGPLWPYINDENITDIKWNGAALVLNDLKKGRYVATNEDGTPVTLDEDFVMRLCLTFANANDVHFNYSEPSLMAETEQLRIQANHSSKTGHGKCVLAIRKTPPVARLEGIDRVSVGYADEFIDKMIPCLVRARLSGIITGDVGAGKTELQKWMIKFIPNIDGICTVEDVLEMKANELYPEKDIITIKYDEQYTEEMAIKDCLRLMAKWLILAEARGKDIKRVIEAASTGCKALCTIHAENTWELPDRIMNMVGRDAAREIKNDVFTFFNYAIKVSQHITENGIQRHIDQISFFYRENEKNFTVNFIKDGKYTGEELPKMILDKINNCELEETDKYELPFLEMYKRKQEEARLKME